MTDTDARSPPLGSSWSAAATPASSSGVVQLDQEYFGALVNVPLLHQVVTAQLAAKRSGTHSTKTRAEVSGGGAKPYSQKGTGRARQGTTRAPQFTGGGIAFGPKPRDYTQSTPRKMVRQALRAALSDRAARRPGLPRRPLVLRGAEDQGGARLPAVARPRRQCAPRRQQR